MLEGGQIIAKTLHDLTTEEKGDFYSWVDSFTPELDNEIGGDDPESMLNWLKQHEAIPNDTTFVFYLASEEGGDRLLGTLSLVQQDRDWCSPLGGWILGGFNVRRELRGCGYGNKIMKRVKQELTARAFREGRAIGML
jgi:hypothetical protein